MKRIFQFSAYSALTLFVFFVIPVTAAADYSFKLNDMEGKSHSLADYGNTKAIVVFFVSTRCPVSNAYNGRMESLFQEFKDKKIAFLGINSNKTEPIAEVRSHARENSLTFPILKDQDNIVADRYEAEFTPEVFVLDPGGKLLYHGRIDNDRREDRVKSRDLSLALKQIERGQSVGTTDTKAFGCTIKRIQK